MNPISPTLKINNSPTNPRRINTYPLSMSVYPRIILKPNKTEALERFHPWVFSGAIQRMEGNPTEGDVVEVYSNAGKYLATGHYQAGSIAVRVLDFGQRTIDRSFLQEKLIKAWELRKKLGLWGQSDTTMFRLVHGEGDQLPGLIIDYYQGLFVIQCHSLGFYLMRQTISDVLVDTLLHEVKAIYNKSETTLPFKAPATPGDEYLYGSRQALQAKEWGLSYHIDVEGGQKTGFFVDQRDNRALLAYYSEGRDVLNAFSYTGGFTLSALQGGAIHVDSLDSSQKAIDLLEKNLALNFSENGTHTSYCEDAFDFLNKMPRQYDLIVLDPPAFAKHHDVLDRALRGYRTINQKAISHLPPGGILFTFSCSQAVSRDDFRKTLFSAAAMAKRPVKILHQLTQPPDHPIDIYHPEGEYLKGLVLEIG